MRLIRWFGSRVDVSQEFFSSGIWGDFNRFIPKNASKPSTDLARQVAAFIMSRTNLIIITGAGASTESGIPDYRSKGVGIYARENWRPVQHQEFIKHSHVRRRYWARNYVGWPVFSTRDPNPTHDIIAKFLAKGTASSIITQNVDRLHHKACDKIDLKISSKIIELHGTTHNVTCFRCSYICPRESLQSRIKLENPGFLESADGTVTPDGDFELPSSITDKFKQPLCPGCGGDFLKPDVVFFGDNVAKEKVARASETIKNADGVLVVGSSLQVYSIYRFILAAAEQSTPIVSIGVGSSRGDHLFSFKMPSLCADSLKLIDRFLD